MSVVATPKIELELSGRGNGWTDVTADVRDSVPIICEYGVRGSSPKDRVAQTGTLTFALDNSESNSAGLLGYYSPDNANVRAGFDINIRVRYSLIYNAVTYVRFIGKIQDIVPTPGIWEERLAQITVVDFIDEAARTKIEGLTVQQNKRSDELFSQTLATMAEQPNATEIGVGIDVYPIAFDSLTKDESTAVLTEWQNLALSEMGYIFQKANGTLVYEDRRKRGRTSSNVQNFTNFFDLAASRSRSRIINKVQIVAYTRELDADATTVLYALVSKPQIAAGNTLKFFGPYRDPNQRTSRVGGMDMQPLVAFSDYALNTLENGTGEDLTPQSSVTASFTGNGVRFTVTNNSGKNGFITKLQCRGRGIYILPAVAEAVDDVSIVQNGDSAFNVSMPFQSDLTVADEAARYILGLYKDRKIGVDRYAFWANEDDASMVAALVREISDRIGITESVTGVSVNISGTSATRGFFINAVKLVLESGGALLCEWTLAPADGTSYWILEQPGASELDQTTRLGYGLFSGHADVAHVDTHSDTAHGDSPHSDTHSDVPHSDGHEDSLHSDVAHSDVAHSDTHGDTAHSDVAHSDVPHNDSHSDVAHGDIAHSDVAHSDVAHSDSLHGDHDDYANHVDSVHVDQNSHGDAAHGDVAHEDVAHSDVAHSDSHTDNLHSDTHNDTLHSDVAHSDVAHSDTHSDVLHSDVPHSDAAHTDHTDNVAHSDTHSDVNHSDSTHGDSHEDVAHQDITS